LHDTIGTILKLLPHFARHYRNHTKTTATFCTTHIGTILKLLPYFARHISEPY